MADELLRQTVFGIEYPFDRSRLAAIPAERYQPAPETLADIAAGCRALAAGLRRYTAMSAAMSTGDWMGDTLARSVMFGEVQNAALWLEQSLNPGNLPWGDSGRKRLTEGGWGFRVFADLTTLGSWFDAFLTKMDWQHFADMPSLNRRVKSLLEEYKGRSEPIPSEKLTELKMLRPQGLTIPTFDLQPLEAIEESLTRAVETALLQAVPVVEADEPQAVEVPIPEPVKLLTSWREILVALGMTDNEEDRRKVRGLNETADGPIVSRGQGSQPIADKAKLIAWYNGLEAKFATQNHQRDAAATVASHHPYARDGEVYPDVGGGEKQRRRKRTP